MLLTVLLFCSVLMVIKGGGQHFTTVTEDFEDISLDNMFDYLKELSIFGKI